MRPVSFSVPEMNDIKTGASKVAEGTRNVAGKVAERYQGSGLQSKINGARTAYMAPVSETTIKGRNVGKGLKSLSGKLDEVIINQGEINAAKAMKGNKVHLTKGDLSNIGSKTFKGKFASIGKGILGKMGKVAKIIPGATAAIAIYGEVGNVVKGFKEGRGLAQIGDSACKIGGSVVGSVVGAGAAALALGFVVSNPVGWVAGGVAIAGAITGATYGEKIGDKIGDGVAGFISGIGLSGKKKDETQQIFATTQANPQQLSDIERQNVALQMMLMDQLADPYEAMLAQTRQNNPYQ